MNSNYFLFEAEILKAKTTRLFVCIYKYKYLFFLVKKGNRTQ
jgi:hypothetical protein